jgi:polyisoprenyl-phosphate glycosyltransferase
MDISIVVPMYNEAPSLDTFFDTIIPILESQNLTFEIICVNDGSLDGTLTELRRRREAEPRIKIVDLSRNFGKESALTAGIDAAQGRAVVPMDADLQDPPELLGEMVSCWRAGAKVVLAQRRDRQSDPVMKRLTAGWFYNLVGALSTPKIPPDVGDFRLMDRAVVDALQRLPERSRFMKGIFTWVGFETTYVGYSRNKRSVGKSKFNYRRLWNLALDGIFSFSAVPLKIWSYFGATISLTAAIYLIIIVAKTILFGVDLPGYASLISVILFTNGIIILGMGIIGEYIARIFVEVKQRPIYIVSSREGFDDK